MRFPKFALYGLQYFFGLNVPDDLPKVPKAVRWTAPFMGAVGGLVPRLRYTL